MQAASQFEERVIRAAEAVLAGNQYVSLADLFMALGFLAPSAYSRWRLGREPHLEPLVQAGAQKLAGTKSILQKWAAQGGLVARQITCPAQTLGPRSELHFTQGGDPEGETLYRTYYFSPDLGERRLNGLIEKLGRPPGIVAFSIVKDSHCARCQSVVLKGDLLIMQGNDPLCLRCAGLDHLVFLASGEAGLTRRATKYSGISAVILRYSRSRKRYERQGILVEAAALERAQQESGL